jgi:hypothetical protein
VISRYGQEYRIARAEFAQLIPQGVKDLALHLVELL